VEQLLAFAAGLVALLLQRQPTLDAEQAKTLLRGHSSIPDQPAGTYDAKWGYGLIRADGLKVGRTRKAAPAKKAPPAKGGGGAAR
jgi:hypothetical protein